MTTNEAPAAELPKHYQPAEVEARWAALWEEKGYFAPSPDDPGDPFCIVIPPPNVTGALHMGHGLDETIQDALVRFQRMRGRNALWVPGTDHAGIATQHVVAEKLRREGKDPRAMGRDAFVEQVWAWKDEHGRRIVEQLRRLGCSCDWGREAFTLDEPRQLAVRRAFKTLFDRGLIFRGEYLVNWDPVDRTALSDDEVEYEDEKGHLWRLRYPLADGSGHVVVATTRPETMLGDTAVAVNPTDERWKHLIGQQVRLPLVDRLVPIIADDFVKKDFGSGLVKITPGHDPNDFLCGLRHDLPMINILTEDAHINGNGGKFEGLDRFEARKRVVAEFQALGLLDGVDPHDHRVGRGYRSKAIIEPRLSKQWFVKVGPLAEKALAAVEDGRIRILPGHPWGDVYRNWMTNVRDWCISRQLWWGHRIPIWQRKDDPEAVVCWDGEGMPPEAAAEPDAWEQETDVLDTWFSSALWPASVLGWPDEDAPDFKRWYPTSVLVTGHDILFFWVARMAMFGIELAGDIPFKDVYLHGLIFGKSHYLDEGGRKKLIPPLEARRMEAEGTLPKKAEAKWEKMSKSKGNVIDPLQVIDEFGADALRLTVSAYAGLGRNIDLDWTRFEGYRNFVNKLWNATRFVLMVTEPLDGGSFRRGADAASLRAEDCWILSELARAVDAVTAHLEDYELDKAVQAIYDFTWRSYCDWYVEIAKGRVYGDDAASRDAARVVLLTVVEHICRLLHPFTPFATEEIWQILRARLAGLDPGEPGTPAPDRAMGFPDGFGAPSLCVAPWPAAHPQAVDPDAEAAMALLQEAAGAIRNIRGEMRVPVEMKLEAVLEHGDPASRAALADQAGALAALCGLSSLRVEERAGRPKFASTWVSGALTVLVVLPEELLAAERERLAKELAFAEKGLAASRSKLANEKFLSKAPDAVVAAERDRAEKLEADAAALRRRIEELAG